MPRTRGGAAVGRSRGRASNGVPGHDQMGDPNDYQEELPRLQRHLKKLKWKAYKGLLWALRMDHQKINWGLELAIEEIKKALDIPQEEHNKIVEELENDFRQIEAEANRRAGVCGDDYEMKIHGAHELLHVEEKLYEWLNLNELLPDDIQWECPMKDNDKNVVSQETIYLYETSQLMGMEQKHLLDMALEAINKIVQLRDQNEPQNEERFGDADDRDGGDNQGVEEKVEEETEEVVEEAIEGEEDDNCDDGIKAADNEGNDDSDGSSNGSSRDSSMSGDSSSDDASSDSDD